MGIVELLLYIIVVVLIGWAAIWLLGMLAPGHPAIIDNIIWVVVVICVALIFAEALGLTGLDPRVPRLR